VSPSRRAREPDVERSDAWMHPVDEGGSLGRSFAGSRLPSKMGEAAVSVPGIDQGGERGMSTKGAASRWLLAACACVLLPGCFTFVHTVGRGPMNPQPVQSSDTKWFALWGIAEMNQVDSQQLAGNAKDYRVTTKFTVLDVVISAFTSFVSFYRQTVIVEK
jgi:hypothetical protein